MNEQSPSGISKEAVVFTAHPDDHVCAAGTLMLLKDKGFNLREVVATGGERGVWWLDDGKKHTGFEQAGLVQKRKEELSEAARLIGIDSTSWLGLPDSGIERTFTLVNRISAIIRRQRPGIVFTMNTRDYHSDHRKLSDIVVEGAERASWSYQPELGEPYKVPLLLLMEGFYLGRNHVAVDVTKYQSRKQSLLRAYGSQIDARERRLLEDINSYRGFFRRDAKIKTVETFELSPEFPVYLNGVMEMFSTG